MITNSEQQPVCTSSDDDAAIRRSAGVHAQDFGLPGTEAATRGIELLKKGCRNCQTDASCSTFECPEWTVSRSSRR